MFKVPEKYRVITGQGATTKDAGNNGVFYIPLHKKQFLTARGITYGQLQVVASNGRGWNHISVCVTTNDKKRVVERTPTWDEMCIAKAAFWGDEDVCVQFHPRKSEYVNTHKYVLHIWERIGSYYETPPMITV